MKTFSATSGFNAKSTPARVRLIAFSSDASFLLLVSDDLASRVEVRKGLGSDIRFLVIWRFRKTSRYMTFTTQIAATSTFHARPQADHRVPRLTQTILSTQASATLRIQRRSRDMLVEQIVACVRSLCSLEGGQKVRGAQGDAADGRAALVSTTEHKWDELRLKDAAKLAKERREPRYRSQDYEAYPQGTAILSSLGLGSSPVYLGIFFMKSVNIQIEHVAHGVAHYYSRKPVARSTNTKISFPFYHARDTGGRIKESDGRGGVKSTDVRLWNMQIERLVLGSAELRPLGFPGGAAGRKAGVG
ncbi:hypothetical protein V8E53_014448 [Lactarius tabidus]